MTCAWTSRWACPAAPSSPPGWAWTSPDPAHFSCVAPWPARQGGDPASCHVPSLATLMSLPWCWPQPRTWRRKTAPLQRGGRLERGNVSEREERRRRWLASDDGVAQISTAAGGQIRRGREGGAGGGGGGGRGGPGGAAGA